ncbi:MAG: hypothetical protein Q4E59_07210 [Bacteroidales bacterium]|nr:hypothetical protein [Bacteroidales bacterium]
MITTSIISFVFLIIFIRCVAKSLDEMPRKYAIAFLGLLILWLPLTLKEGLVFPGYIWILIQIVTVAIISILFMRTYFQYKNLVAKENKTENDIKGRQRIISRLTYLVLFSVSILLFFLNSWGFHLLGSLEPTSTLNEKGFESFIVQIASFIDDSIGVCLFMTMVVFLADSFLQELVTPIHNVEDVNDIEKFCLYLRSFNKDNNKEEKLICKVAKRLYPVYAIGDPNKVLQPNGAERIYVTDSKWKDVVGDMSVRSKLILLRISQTDGTMWEIINIIKSQLIHKTIFIAYNKEDYLYFSKKISEHLNFDLQGIDLSSEKPVAFFIDENNCTRMRVISKEKDVESLINEFLSCTPNLDLEYEQDLNLRLHDLYFIFPKIRN